jgi:hypothetical protein
MLCWLIEDGGSDTGINGMGARGGSFTLHSIDEFFCTLGLLRVVLFSFAVNSPTARRINDGKMTFGSAHVQLERTKNKNTETQVTDFIFQLKI